MSKTTSRTLYTLRKQHKSDIHIEKTFKTTHYKHEETQYNNITNFIKPHQNMINNKNNVKTIYTLRNTYTQYKH